MESCQVCRNLVPLPGPSGGFITGGRGIDLAKSASGCQLCFILWEGLSSLSVHDPEKVHWMALKQDNSAFRLQYRFSEDHKTWFGLHFYTRTAESPLSDIFKPSLDLEPDTACDRYLTQVQSWVHECHEKHDRCRERRSSSLPTRVLNVSLHEDFVFLYEPEQTQTGLYVALSHVWGGAVPIQTTADSINRFKDGIRLESLPKTFRDAVFMTRRLKCEYLWIDSLCIIQDSKEDWAREAARMAGIYGNSYVTIAAVKSANSNGGLFSSHEAATAKRTIRCAGDGGRDVVIDVRPALEHSSYYNCTPYGLLPNTEAWLLGRAWCFQEYLLSPRLLLFTDWEILWVCHARMECNCGEYSRDARSIVSESALKIRFDKTIRNGTDGESHMMWRDIVNHYSSKNLTFATDKLPALAGIAHLLSDKGLGRYVNGLWESTLVSDLFWEVRSIFMGYFKINGRRSGGPSMPSWSWASVTCPVDLNQSASIRGLEVVEMSFERGIPGSFTDVSAKALTLRGILIDARAWCLRLTVDGGNETSWVVDVETEVPWDRLMDVYILCGISGPGLVLDLIEGSSDTYKRLGKINSQFAIDRSHYATKVIRLV